MPLWMSTLLDRLHIFPASFSKYGTYYQQQILSHSTTKGAIFCA